MNVAILSQVLVGILDGYGKMLSALRLLRIVVSKFRKKGNNIFVSAAFFVGKSSIVFCVFFWETLPLFALRCAMSLDRGFKVYVHVIVCLNSIFM